MTTNSFERTEILYGEEKVTNATLQSLSKADRIDSCADHRTPSQAIETGLGWPTHNHYLPET